MSSAKSSTPMSAKLVTKHRPCIMEDMERLLALWIDDMCTRDDSPMTNIAIQEKALTLYEDLCAKQTDSAGPSSATPAAAPPSFTASKGWLERFKKRFHLHSVTQKGESAGADKAAAAAYPQTLKNIIEEGGYTAQQVFNFDETGLYWKRMPKNTVLSKEEKSARGHKVSKDRVSLLLGGNAEGDFNLKVLLIHHSENPRALKGHVKATLPIIYRSNKKAWTTRSIFEDWFTNFFCPAVERYCRQKNITHKALLLLDNAPSHPVNLSDLSEHIRVEFLPPNTTSLLQPMDQGVISTFKAYYLRRTFRQMIRAVDSDENMSFRQFWKNFNIKNAIDIIAESWKEVKDSNMNAVWKKLWPDCVHSFTGFPRTQAVVTEIVNLAHQVGFNEVEEEDIDNLLASHREELSNEDLMAIEQDRAAEEEAAEEEEIAPQLQLTRKILSDSFSHFDIGLQGIVDNDPNRERSLKLEQQIKSALASYKQLYYEKVLQAKQSTITSFLKRTAAPAAKPASAAPTSSEDDANVADDTSAPSSTSQ